MVWKTELLAQFNASNLENIGEEDDDEDKGDEGEEEKDADDGVEEGPEVAPGLNPARIGQIGPDLA